MLAKLTVSNPLRVYITQVIPRVYGPLTQWLLQPCPSPDAMPQTIENNLIRNVKEESENITKDQQLKVEEAPAEKEHPAASCCCCQ